MWTKFLSESHCYDWCPYWCCCGRLINPLGASCSSVSLLLNYCKPSWRWGRCPPSSDLQTIRLPLCHLQPCILQIRSQRVCTRSRVCTCVHVNVRSAVSSSLWVLSNYTSRSDRGSFPSRKLSDSDPDLGLVMSETRVFPRLPLTVLFGQHYYARGGDRNKSRAGPDRENSLKNKRKYRQETK